MTAKQYLNQIRELEKEIEFKKSYIEQLRAIAEKSTSIISPTSSSCSNDSKLENCIVKIADAEAEISREIEELLNKQKEIRHTIAEIDDSDIIRILELRYILGMRWEEAEIFSGYSERHIMRLHAQGLALIDEILKKRKDGS